MKFINVVVVISFAACLFHVTNAGSPIDPCENTVSVFNRSIEAIKVTIQGIVNEGMFKMTHYHTGDRGVMPKEEFSKGLEDILAKRDAEIMTAGNTVVEANSVANNIPYDVIRDFISNGVPVTDFPLSCITNVGVAREIYNAAIKTMRDYMNAIIWVNYP